jgi:hypothetical protein
MMSKLPIFRSKVVYAAHFCLFITVAICSAQQSKVMGEVRFEGATKVEKDSGVWVDGDYVGFLKELHGDKKLMLLPGEHEISVRHQATMTSGERLWWSLGKYKRSRWPCTSALEL